MGNDTVFVLLKVTDRGEGRQAVGVFSALSRAIDASGESKERWYQTDAHGDGAWFRGEWEIHGAPWRGPVSLTFMEERP